MNKQILIDRIDRQIIIHFYREASFRGGCWVLNNKPMIASNLELSRSFRDFDRLIQKALDRSYGRFVNWLSKQLEKRWI